MKIDRYTKVILTIIAVRVIGLNQFELNLVPLLGFEPRTS